MCYTSKINRRYLTDGEMAMETDKESQATLCSFIVNCHNFDAKSAIILTLLLIKV